MGKFWKRLVAEDMGNSVVLEMTYKESEALREVFMWIGGSSDSRRKYINRIQDRMFEAGVWYDFDDSSEGDVKVVPYEGIYFTSDD